jgi:hypothetical protein
VEAPQVLLRDIVLALALGKGNKVNPFIRDELLDVAANASLIGTTAVVEAKRWPRWT